MEVSCCSFRLRDLAPNVPGHELSHTDEDSCGPDYEFLRIGRRQKLSRRPSWISRFGSAEVKANGWLGERAALPCTLNVVNLGARAKPKSGLTSLLTLAKFVRFARLNPSAVSCR